MADIIIILFVQRKQLKLRRVNDLPEFTKVLKDNA